MALPPSFAPRLVRNRAASLAVEFGRVALNAGLMQVPAFV